MTSFKAYIFRKPYKETQKHAIQTQRNQSKTPPATRATDQPSHPDSEATTNNRAERAPVGTCGSEEDYGPLQKR